MSLTINVDRFTRLKQSISGKFSPNELPGLREYLAGDDGEINFSLAGNLTADIAGGHERRLKCIIYGWFLISDPVTLAAVRHVLNVESSLVLVNDESQLPPLEMESESEDYIICGAQMHVMERIEEEVLLNLPAHAINRKEMPPSIDVHRLAGKIATKKTVEKSATTIVESAKVSPFAKLAGLKKKE